jgi:hypothetical protein
MSGTNWPARLHDLQVTLIQGNVPVCNKVACKISWQMCMSGTNWPVRLHDLKVTLM